MMRKITEEEWLSLVPGDKIYFGDYCHDWRVVLTAPSLQFASGLYKCAYGTGSFSTMNDYWVPTNFKTKKAEEEKQSVYILWNPKSNLAPKTTFSTRDEAIKVAYIMAGKNPGETFNVCKVVGAATTQSVKYEDYEKGK